MSDQDREVTITIRGKNLSESEFAAARTSLAGLKQQAKDADEGFSKLWDGLKKGAGLLGVTFGIEAVADFTAKVFETASAIGDMASRYDISAEAAQRFKYAAEQGGAAMEDVGAAIDFANKAIDGGDQAFVAALKKAHVSLDDIRQQRPEDMFRTLAEAVRSIEDPFLRANVAADLFGKGPASKLMPAIRDGIKEVGDQTTVMADKTVADLKRAGDNWSAFWNAVVVHSGNALGWLMDAQHRQAVAAAESLLKMSEAEKLAWAEAQAHSQVMLNGTTYAVEYAKALEQLKKKHEDIKLPVEEHRRVTHELTKEQQDAIKATTDLAEAEWAEQIAAQKRFTDKSKKEMDDFFKDLEDKQKQDTDSASAAWAEQLADHDHFVKESQRQMDEFFAQQDEDRKADTELAAADWAEQLARHKQLVDQSDKDMDKFFEGFKKKQKSVWDTYRRDAGDALQQVADGVAASLLGMSGQLAREHQRTADDTKRTYDEMLANMATSLDDFRQSAQESYDSTEKSATKAFERTQRSVAERLDDIRENALERFNDIKNNARSTPAAIAEAWADYQKAVAKAERDADRDIEDARSDMNDRITDAHDKMLKDVEQKEEASNAELEKAHQEMLDAKEAASHRWKDNLNDIWAGVKTDFGHVLTEMLGDFEHAFLDGMIAAILGRKGGFGAAFNSVMGWGPGGFGGAGAGAGAGGAGGAGGVGAGIGLGAAAGITAGLVGVAAGAYLLGGLYFQGPGDKYTAPDESTGYHGFDNPNNPFGGFDPGNPDLYPQYASGGVVARKQLALIAERGQREIVGSVPFMTEALVGALQRTGVSNRVDASGAGPASTPPPLLVQFMLQNRVLFEAMLEHIRVDAAGRVEWRVRQAA